MDTDAPPKRIAVMRYRFVGDTLLTIPFLRALRKQYPKAVIHLLVGSDAITVMDYCPYIDEAIVFNPRKMGWWSAVTCLRHEHYDVVYILKRSFSSALLAFLAGIPQRIGFDTEKRGFLLTKKLPYRPTEMHEALCFLSLLDASKRHDLSMGILDWIPDKAYKKIRHKIDLREEDGPLVALHITSSNPAKCWPMDYFAELAKRLVKTYHAHVIMFGTGADHMVVQSFIDDLDDETARRCTNACGRTSLLETIAALTNVTLVVANDSGMVHLASAAEVPVVALFGPMNPEQWAPLNPMATILTVDSLNCRPCNLKITCNHTYPCLTELTPDRVFDACKPYLTR